MDIKQLIVTTKPREEAGSRTSRKYDFQYNLSLYLLLKEHNQRNDYVYFFDYHDDLMILDSPDNPSKIDFYQIKSKDKGNWSATSLKKSDDDDELSIISKLYLNKINFPQNTNTLNFISNASFNFKAIEITKVPLVKIDFLSKDFIKASELDKSDLHCLTESINRNHSITTGSDFAALTNFIVTPLSNMDSSTHCLGELTKLLYSINSSHKINLQLAYQQIISEVSRLNRITVGNLNISSLQQLIELKGMTKKKFLEILSKAGLYLSFEDEWTEISQQLSSTNIGAIEMLKYRSAFREVSTKLISEVEKIPLTLLKNELSSVMDNQEFKETINDKSPLIEIVDYCSNKVKSELYNEYFIKCLTIKILYERN